MSNLNPQQFSAHGEGASSSVSSAFPLYSAPVITHSGHATFLPEPRTQPNIGHHWVEKNLDGKIAHRFADPN